MNLLSSESDHSALLVLAFTGSSPYSHSTVSPAFAAFSYVAFRLTCPMLISYSTLFFLSFTVLVTAQNCENYGSQNGSSCACPPGFGGTTCNQPSCGGDIFQGSLRNSTSAGNLTAGGCSCESGWTGTGCNVCQSASACQAGFVNARPTAGQVPLSQAGQNDTLTCSTAARVWAAGHMSCKVNVSSLYYFLSYHISEICTEPDSSRGLSLVVHS